MLEYNLTQRERQILVRIIELSKNSKDYFEAHLVDAAVPGPGREVARLNFGGAGDAMELTKRDLRVLKDEGFVHFRWHLQEHGAGRLTSLAFEAAGSDFHTDDGAGDAAEAAEAARALVAADEGPIETRFRKITAELVTLAGRLIDADEARSAEHEARAIEAELRKVQPDEAVLTRKIKGFVGRLSLTFSGTADLAAKGEAIGEFGERLAAWLVALSIWTEWHVVHRSAPTPKA